MVRQADHQADVCVIGGGMAGLAAALSAARRGAQVVLMHDRPVLGGNSSSECRVHVCGADRHNHIPNLRETGILEELRLENIRRNPQRSFSIWDTVLYDACRRQSRLKLLLNCSCCQAGMDGRRIENVTGWQTTTQTFHRVSAGIFIDTSGDAVLAPLTGAACDMGREGRDEYGESLAPARRDQGTMGMTLAFIARPCDSPQPFEPPSWARRYDRCQDLPGEHSWWGLGYWWVELGGMQHSIHDTEDIRDELLAVVYGIWDHIKNRGPHGADNWALDWVQFLPAKRESRRYAGRHVLTQNDIQSGGKFPDVVAYGGWTIDEHPPVGVNCAKLGLAPANFTDVPSPYGIAYGCLVARDLENLMFAGRCASFTHQALSSARVMGTAAVMGQAAGTAAALATARGLVPGDVSGRIDQLQQQLLEDDCYLPGVSMRFSELNLRAKLSASGGDPAPLRDGVNRPVGADQHAWSCGVGDSLTLDFGQTVPVERLTLIADSALDQHIAMSHWGDASRWLGAPPQSLLKDARVEVLADGNWQDAVALTGNYQRRVRISVGRRCQAVRVTIQATWGERRTRIFSAWVD